MPRPAIARRDEEAYRCGLRPSLREAGRSASKAKMRSFEALNEALASLGSAQVAGTGPIDDRSSDALLTAAWLRKAGNDSARWKPASLTPDLARTEGWTFGAI